MSTITQPAAEREIVYPESDGQPMAENTLQFRWIVTIEGGLEAQYRDDPQVFVAGDQLWYPVKGNNRLRMAPDAMVVFGRPKGYRGAYLQWLEDDIAPQVVFEVLSPGNRFGELLKKFKFYEQYGIEEYYLFDPDRIEITGWRRLDGQLQELPDLADWKSPRLGIRFDLSSGDLVIYGRDGRPFATYVELFEQRARQEQEAEQARRGKERAESERDEERQRVERLIAQMKAQGLEPQL